MKATDSICPYTGLRSFTEEESLYFKGRDLQVRQIASLLEQNRFLMVTGASGEGKSSLIYAGLVPNARAGFFKAKYTNWIVADFRPERSPVRNMARALAESFGLQPATVETEIRRGFSSLTDLYRNSGFFIDEEDPAWKSQQDSEKAVRKRKAANLLLIVDQFEEFFTNPENFINETPSQDSQVVVNLILETARIAIRQGLPVYIVCTMRSDYIGQCSAFRGLPEYIGFSQFFVPRLKRKDLKQVIEEPAILSGNRISQRLIERLVYDVSEGVDQLPILQHALSQIWQAASHGQEEMDLIHYAMVGGMPADELPESDTQRYHNWFQSLPEHERPYYKETGLGKIIEIHASTLYENAWMYHNERHPGKLVTQQDAKRIIALTFSCLTKIDNSRAVRNRMTLGEITSIVNRPDLDYRTVGHVLNAYREEGNSFIRPFISEDPTGRELSEDAVLDITHESLIRNWNKLNKWATQEFDFYSTYLDFKKQLDRWKQSGKDSGYLLPIGPLTYFENWYNTCNPNVGWISRYIEHSDSGKPVEDASVILADTREFLKSSARKVIITRAFMKYGPQRIATLLAMVIMVVLSGFYWYDAEQKKAERVIEKVRQQAYSFLDRTEVANPTKAVFLLTEERYQQGTILQNLNKLQPRDKLSISVEAYTQLVTYDKNHEDTLKSLMRNYAAERIRTSGPEIESDLLLKQLNRFCLFLIWDNYYSPSDSEAALLQEMTTLGRDRALAFYKDAAMFQPGISPELNLAIQLWLNSGNVTDAGIDELLKAISPASGEMGQKAFDVYYSKGSTEPNGRQTMDFNNGFHMLASVYSAKGDLDGVIWAFNKILESNQRYYFELARMFNNHINIVGFLYQFGHRDKAPELIKWLEKNTQGNPAVTILRNAVLRAGYMGNMYLSNLTPFAFRSYRGYYYPNLFLANHRIFDELCDDYEKEVAKNSNANERNYLMAMNLKRRAMFTHKYWYDRGMPLNGDQLDIWLSGSMEHFRKIDKACLQEKVPVTFNYWGDGVRNFDMTRHDLYVYPDYRDGWFSFTYHSDYFFNYLNNHRLLPELFKTESDLNLLHTWVARGFAVSPGPAPGVADNFYAIPDETLEEILSFVDQHQERASFDQNLLVLILCNRAFEAGDTERGMKYAAKFDQEHIARSLDRYEYIEKTFLLNQVKELCIHLAESGKYEASVAMTGKFLKPEDRAYSYLLTAEEIFRKSSDPRTFMFLDSAYKIIRGLDFTTLPFPMDSRYNLIRLMSRIGSEEINNLALTVLREIQEQNKYFAIQGRIVGVAAEGNFYRALTSIPSTLTETQDLECRTMIMAEACKAREKSVTSPMWRAMDLFNEWEWRYIFFFPN
ncbi:MAG: ATP-binding protein [Bacteroidetes bacterium]|nr:ATP-binding protein [Bacteroidota bacterium]